MLTWLDWYCRNFSRDADERMRRLWGNEPRLLSLMLTIERARAGGFDAVSSSYDPSGFTFWMRCFLPFVAPYAPPEADPVPENIAHPLGLILTKPTAEMLGGAKPPPVTLRDIVPNAHDPVYVDLPHGAFRIADDLQLRAILAKRTNLSSAPGAPFEPMTVVTSVVSERGSDRPIAEYYFKSTDGGSDYVDVFCLPGSTRPIGWSETALDAATVTELCRRTDAILKLALCYYYFSPREMREPVHSTPSTIVERRNGFPKKNESLFSMTRLHAAPNRLGRPVPQGSAGWSLTDRQDVTGHFKLQAFGPQWSERRMIWIDAYERGPADAPRRPKGVTI